MEMHGGEFPLGESSNNYWISSRQGTSGKYQPQMGLYTGSSLGFPCILNHSAQMAGHWATDNDQNYLSCAASLAVWKLFSRFSLKAHLQKQHHFCNNLGSCCWGNFVADKQVWKRPETQERQVENIVRGIIYWDVKRKFDKNLCQSQLERRKKFLSSGIANTTNASNTPTGCKHCHLDDVKFAMHFV